MLGLGSECIVSGMVRIKVKIRDRIRVRVRERFRITPAMQFR